MAVGDKQHDRLRLRDEMPHLRHVHQLVAAVETLRKVNPESPSRTDAEQTAIEMMREALEGVEAHHLPRVRRALAVFEAPSPLLAAINRAAQIIELADERNLANDGPAGGFPPQMTLAEWRDLYVTLDNARNAHV